MLEHVQVVDYCHPTRIEEVLALAEIAGTVALPVSNVRQGKLDFDPLAQLGPTQRGQLALARLGQELLVKGAEQRLYCPPRPK